MAATVQSQWAWGRTRFRSKQKRKRNKQIDLYERVRPTWPSSAISKVSSRLPIRVTVSSAMSVMFENIASSSWVVVRSSWEYWEYCKYIGWFSEILHLFYLDRADEKNSTDQIRIHQLPAAIIMTFSPATPQQSALKVSKQRMLTFCICSLKTFVIMCRSLR